MLEVEEKSVHSIATLLIACTSHEENNDYWNYHLHVLRHLYRDFSLLLILKPTACVGG